MMQKHTWLCTAPLPAWPIQTFERAIPVFILTFRGAGMALVEIRPVLVLVASPPVLVILLLSPFDACRVFRPASTATGWLSLLLPRVESAPRTRLSFAAPPSPLLVRSSSRTRDPCSTSACLLVLLLPPPLPLALPPLPPPLPPPAPLLLLPLLSRVCRTRLLLSMRLASLPVSLP